MSRLSPVSLCMLVLLLSSGCTLYGRMSGKSSYLKPEVSVENTKDLDHRPIVLLITGSMIVSDFFDVMVERLKKDGFRPIVYQPRDLITSELPVIAQEIGDAVQKVLELTGEKNLRIIAECNGGIATRYYINRLGGYQYVDRFISFVSAHHGTASFKIAWYDGLRDIKPQSDYMQEIRNDRLPEGATTGVVSVYFCDDEIMEPYTTSKIPDALNVAFCDDRVVERAKARDRYKVHHFLGARMIPMFPVHFAGFWDESLYDFFHMALVEDLETLKTFNELNATFTMGMDDPQAP